MISDARDHSPLDEGCHAAHHLESLFFPRARAAPLWARCACNCTGEHAHCCPLYHGFCFFGGFCNLDIYVQDSVPQRVCLALAGERGGFCLPLSRAHDSSHIPILPPQYVKQSTRFSACTRSPHVLPLPFRSFSIPVGRATPLLKKHVTTEPYHPCLLPLSPRRISCVLV